MDFEKIYKLVDKPTNYLVDSYNSITAHNDMNVLEELQYYKILKVDMTERIYRLVNQYKVTIDIARQILELIYSHAQYTDANEFEISGYTWEEEVVDPISNLVGSKLANTIVSDININHKLMGAESTAFIVGWKNSTLVFVTGMDWN